MLGTVRMVVFTGRWTGAPQPCSLKVGGWGCFTVLGHKKHVLLPQLESALPWRGDERNLHYGNPTLCQALGQGLNARHIPCTTDDVSPFSNKALETSRCHQEVEPGTHFPERRGTQENRAWVRVL